MQETIIASSDKKVVDTVSGWLRIYDDGSVDRIWTGPPEVKFLIDPVPPHHDFVDGVATTDLTVNSQSALRVRIYLPSVDQPENADSKLPIILHFHGGGFCISQPDWYLYYHFYSRLSRAARAVCVSPYLRLAPEHRLPAAFDDGAVALEWLAAVARGESGDPWLSRYGDFERVFLVGDSAGGNVVHHVAVRARGLDLRLLRVAGAVPINPGFVRAERSRSEKEKPETALLTLEMVDKMLALALPVGATKDHPFTCPMAAEAVDVGPLLVCVAEDDLMSDTQMEYYEAMKKVGKEVEVVVSSGMAHCFYLNKVAVDSDQAVAAQADVLVARITEFIKKH